MTQNSNNQPADTNRYGGIRGVIWNNVGKDGNPDRYSMTYSRSYKTADGQWKETTCLSEIDNLKLGHLIPKIINRITRLKHNRRSETTVGDAAEQGGQ